MKSYFPKIPRKLKKILKVLTIGALALLGIFIILFTGMAFYIEHFCLASPPNFDGDSTILTAPLLESKGTKSIGDCWLNRKNGLYQIYLTGTPFVRGYCHARLTQKLLENQEADFIKNIRERLPSPIKLWLLKKFLTWNNRNLSSYVSQEDQIEIFGLSKGQRDLFPELGPLYHRLLNYHAAHDISHAVMDSPLVGCTSFAAWGSFTSQGHLLLGRNFDFDFVRSFGTDKIVMKVEPDRGFSYISISWAGMIGVVSGMNEKKIAIVINAAHSSDKKNIGTPVSLVIRQALQYSATLLDAIAIIQKSEVFVTDCYLIADGKTSQAVIVEKTPLRCGVVKTTGNLLIVSNHLVSGELKNDAANIENMQESTSVVRYKRMKTLLSKQAKKLTPKIAAEILRDSEVPGGIKKAYGNAAAINSMIATHSVIIDVTQGIIWVAQSPHQLGAYIPFSLENFGNSSNAQVIAADKALQDGTYGKFTKANELIKQGKKAIEAGNLDKGEKLLTQAKILYPQLYTSSFLLGKIAIRKGKKSQGEKYLAQALSLYPAYKKEREEIAQLLSSLRKKEKNKNE